MAVSIRIQTHKKNIQASFYPTYATYDFGEFPISNEFQSQLCLTISHTHHEVLKQSRFQLDLLSLQAK